VVDYKPVDNSGGVKSKKEELNAQLEEIKLQKEIKAQELGFADFAAFKVAKEKQDLKEAELASREEAVEVREGLVTQRENDVVRGAERNDAVKANLISHELQDFKKAQAVRAFAFQNYFGNLDTLFGKLLNAKTGKNCVGLIKRGKKMVDETIAIDVDFLDEVKPLITSIQTVLKISPKFSPEGEYLRQDEVLEDESEDDEQS
jgi:hypothetical protein